MIHAADRYVRASTLLAVTQSEARREAMGKPTLAAALADGAVTREGIERDAING